MNTENDAGDGQQFSSAAAAGAEPPAPAPAGPVQAEPTEGGSYTRNLATGELIKAPLPAAQPDQE